jgi:hypothetical protein
MPHKVYTCVFIEMLKHQRMCGLAEWQMLSKGKVLNSYEKNTYR